MSQPAPKVEKTRTRGRASSLSGSAASTAPSPGKRDGQSPTGQPITPKASKTKKGSFPSEMDVTLNMIRDRLDCLDMVRSDITAIREETSQLRKQHAEEINRLNDMLLESRTFRLQDQRDHKIVAHELNNVKELNRRLAAQLNNVENKLRICNIRIDGLREDDREDLKRIVLEMADTMGVRHLEIGDIASVYRAGKKMGPGRGNGGNAQRIRTVLVTFTNSSKRNKFYFSRTKLRNSDVFKGVYVNDDVTQETRKQREDFRSVAALARADGVDVRMHSDGVILNDTKHLFSEPHTLPSKYSVQAAKTIKTGGEIYFASEHSFLSNFAKAPMVVNNVVYQTAEHYYQSEKCRMANDLDRLGKVLRSTTPLEAKRIADMLTETAEWRNERENIMRKAIDYKFDQNPDLGKRLLDTGDTPLNEATSNTFFGIGVSLHAREISDKSYRGQNKLGQILAEKRTSLSIEH